MMTTTSQPSQPPARVAYLLPDPGIALADSRKGPSIHARSMIAAFLAEGCAVDVYLMRRGKGPLPSGAAIHRARPRGLRRWWIERWLGRERWRRLPGMAARPAPPNWMTALGWLGWQRAFFDAALAGTAAAPPDLIYARDAWLAWPVGALARRTGAPLFVEVNAVAALEKEAYGEAAFRRRARAIETEMLRRAERVLPVSAELVRQVRELAGEGARVELTPNAVDTDLFRPAPEGTPPPPGFTIGAVCSMRPYHGIETLLRAAALLRPEIPELRLLLIGRGPELERLRALAAELGLADANEFTGVLDHAAIPGRLRECRVCVSPNEGEANRYNCPMKLFEYMAMKIPVVASRWGEIPNIVAEGRTGLLHAPGDPVSLAEALRAVRADPAAAAARAEAAWVEAQSRTWRAIARRVLGWAAEARAGGPQR